MYVDAYFDRKKDKILVAERVNGNRILKEIDPAHTFYYEHPSGSQKTIFGDSVRRYTSNNHRKFTKELGIAISKKKRIFESDINPVFRAFADHYMGASAPKLHVTMFDIETDFNPDKGFAPADDPFNAITAISVHCDWLNELVTLALHPPTLPLEEARELVKDIPNTVIFDDETQMLDAFLSVIEDADVLCGYNSSLYDIPYIVGRLKRLKPEWLSRLCLWGQTPRARYVKKFKKDRLTYDLAGRVHLDFYELYLKHNQQQLHSYRLDYVGEIEVGENKIPYDGSLDQLYKQDFRKFIDYNRQDVALLVKLDEKKRYIELSNQVAHGNCVTLKATLGSVALVEQAIINEMHSMNVIAPDRQRTLNERAGIEEDDEENAPVVGAYVAQPDVGLHEWVGCVDINSLYPNTIIATNMSPETILGHFDSTETDTLIAKKIAEGCSPAEAWEGMFHTLEYGHIINETDALLTLNYDDGHSRTMTGKEWREFIFDPNNYMCITANATVFRTDKDGIIPVLLKKWYAERKVLQAHEEYFKNLVDIMVFEPADELKLREEYGILVSDVNLKALLGENVKFYNSRQSAKKILLNSLYGALLNESCRFSDSRMGKSTTLTGRSIVRHMTSKINELVTGEYSLDSTACCLYNDTDSEFSDTLHLTNYGQMTAEALFELCSIKWKSGEKEFSCDDRVKVLSYDPITNEPVMKQFNYVYRHQVKKKGKWKITDALGNEVIVTEDHSVMIERDGVFMEIKPRDICEKDVLISFSEDT